MDPYRAARIFVTFLVVAISCALAYLFYSKVPRNSNNQIQDLIGSAKSNLGISLPNSCNSVIDSCQIEISKDIAVCNPDKLIAEIRKEIANPISSKSCTEVLDKMRNRCPRGCSLVADSLITVAGDVDMEISYIDPRSNKKQFLSSGMKVPEGPCAAIGRRSLNLKADCR